MEAEKAELSISSCLTVVGIVDCGGEGWLSSMCWKQH